jgi:hypothetical protein
MPSSATANCAAIGPRVVDIVFRPLLHDALVDADAQCQSSSGHLRQHGAALLHFTGAKDSGISRLERNLQTVVQARVNLAAIGSDNPLHAIEPALDRPAGLDVVETPPKRSRLHV